MSIQGALTDLMKVFLAFYVCGALVGRKDIPEKLIEETRTKALQGANSKSWGCASIFNRAGDCMTYDPTLYKKNRPIVDPLKKF